MRFTRASTPRMQVGNPFPRRGFTTPRLNLGQGPGGGVGVKRIRAFPLGRTFGLPGPGPSDIRKANKSHAKPLSEAAAELSHRPSATLRTGTRLCTPLEKTGRSIYYVWHRVPLRPQRTTPPQNPCSGSRTKVPPQHTRILPLLAPYRHGFVTKSHIQSPYSEQRPRAILSHILIRSSIAEMFSVSNTPHFAPCSERRQTSSSIFIKNSTTFLISPRVRGRSVADLGSSSSGSFSFNASVIS